MLDQPVPNPLAKNPNVHTHKVFAAVGLILIGTIIIAAGVWYYVSKQSGTSTADDTTTTKVSTSSAKTTTKPAKADETAGWKSFSNDVEKYSIKYPADWLVTNCEMNPIFFAPTETYLGVCNSGFGGLVGVSTVTGTSFSELKNSYMDADYDNLTKQDMVLSGKATTKITGTSKVISEISDETGTKRIVYLVNLGTSTLSIGYSQSKNWQDYSKEFELMVSSFKFIDS